MEYQFDKKLQQLESMMEDMGKKCQEILEYTGRLVETYNEEWIELILKREQQATKQAREIEKWGMELLLLQAPVARDLRQVSAALKMITDLERIAVQGADIVDILKESNRLAHLLREKLIEMADITKEMVDKALCAYIQGDEILAREVIMLDDTVDALFLEAKEMLGHEERLLKEDGTWCLDLLMIAKYYERIGDHAVHIGEWVLFSLTGFHMTYGKGKKV